MPIPCHEHLYINEVNELGLYSERITALLNKTFEELITLALFLIN